MHDLAPNMTDYEETRRTFRLEVPERFNYARDVVDAWAVREPDRLALLAVDPTGGDPRRFTFGDLARLSNQAANFLAAQGIGRGDRVFVMLPRVPEWHMALLGCMKLGAVPMPGTSLLTGRDIAYRVQRAEAVAAIVDEEGVPKIDEARETCETLRTSICVGPGAGAGWLDWAEGLERASDAPPDLAPTLAEDPLVLYFTSGTTGLPEDGAPHAGLVRHRARDHRAVLAGPASRRPALDDHRHGLGEGRMGQALRPVADGRGRVPMGRARADGLRPHAEADRRARRSRRSVRPRRCSVRSALMDLSPYDWGRLRHVVAAGEPLNPEVIRVWREATGLTVHDGYGQTETVNLVANYRCLPVREGSMGKPTPGFDVRIVDDDGVPLGPGQTGHIGVRVAPERPVGLFKEYWRDEEATRYSLRGDFYDTGDTAYTDEDGYLWFVGRADDVITSSAYRIGPFEVESALVEHRAVAEAAVVGKPDRLRGEIVKAFVALKPGYEPSYHLVRDIQDFVKRVTAPYKYPREIEFVDELPKTVSGKIRRVELRQREIDRAAHRS